MSLSPGFPAFSGWSGHRTLWETVKNTGSVDSLPGVSTSVVWTTLALWSKVFNFDVHMNGPGGLWKMQIPTQWPRMASEVLYFYQVSRWCQCCQSWNHTEKQGARVGKLCVLFSLQFQCNPARNSSLVVTKELSFTTLLAVSICSPGSWQPFIYVYERLVPSHQTTDQWRTMIFNSTLYSSIQQSPAELTLKQCVVMKGNEKCCCFNTDISYRKWLQIAAVINADWKGGITVVSEISFPC